MAITAATETGDFSGFLPAHIAQPIFERAARLSVVQRLARQIPLAITGESIPFVSGRPAASWVDEGDIKPATSGAMTLKTMTPKKLAAIMVVSAEVVRANPGNYLATMRESLAESFAVAFDLAALHDAGPTGTAGGGPFSTYVAQTTKVQEIGGTTVANGGIYVDLTTALNDIVSDTDASGRRYQATGWALDSVLEPWLWGAVDTTGSPIFVNLPSNDAQAVLSGAGAGSLMGRPAFMGEGVASPNLTDVVGFVGDWRLAAWGVVGGISYKISTEAAVTINGSLQSLFERNLVAVLAEAEYGFVVADVDGFSKLTNIGNSPVTSS